MNKILQHKYWWLAILFVFVAITYLSSFLHYRVDLTVDKRFTLSPSTKKLISNLDSDVTIKVFLTGDLPADYKKLSIAANDMLNELREISDNKISFHFEEPGKNLNDSDKANLYDSLERLGVVFERNENADASQNKTTNQIIIPSALVFYKNEKPFAIDLRSSRQVFNNYNIVTDDPASKVDKEATRNAAEALLEFKFANAIDKLTRKYIPTIAYATGNGEPIDLTVNDLGESIRNDYRLGVFDLKNYYPDASKIDALLIVKPTKPFTEEDKLKIDQYVMHGGKVFWAVDKLYAELDSLMRSQADFIAFDRNLNLDDILFKYGVRINSDLVQDLNCSKIPIVTGYNPDNSPQFQRFPWAYYPFLSANNNNPISKNLDRVLSIFPSSIDTVKTVDINKTILLASDTNSRRLSSPALVSLKSIELSDADLQTFNKSYVPVAVLLQGKFKSLYANRLTQQVLDSVSKSTGKPFAGVSEKEGKQIVVSDADIVTNEVSHTNGPLPMGELEFENYRFANREFFLNSIDYLVSTLGIFESRNKDFVLRLLDKNKVKEERTEWQLINIAAPIALVILFGAFFQWRRKNKYAA
jgi:ABC-2 type transport system permease protein